MSEKTRLVPRLRFPEFREAEEWRTALAKELIVTIAPPKKLTSDLYKIEGRFPIIDQSKDYICGWTDDEDALVSSDSSLIVFGDHTCTLKIVDRPFAQGADGIKIITPKKVIDPTFLYQYLLFTPVSMESYKRHFSTLKEKQVLYPRRSTGEQQKIATCLSSLDALVTAQADKLDALKTHKKGLMQQLFPRGGETVPRLRFPGFREAGEWEEKTVGDVGQVITGSTPSTAKPEYYGGNIAFVSPADISDLRFVEKTKTSLSTSGFAQTRPIPAYSVMFVCIGSTIGKVAQNTSDCATNQQINSVVPNSPHDPAFLYYLLVKNSDSIAKLAGKQAVPIVNKTLFASVSLLVPDLDEQQRVASCLSSLDALIAAQADKLDALKTHKQGLMQQLFPSPDAVAA